VLYYEQTAPVDCQFPKPLMPDAQFPRRTLLGSSVNRGNGSLLARSRKLVSSIYYGEDGFSLSSTWTMVVG
jgi:hypothetical protein